MSTTANATPRRRPRKSQRTAKLVTGLLRHLLLIVLSLLVVVPIVYMFFASFKSVADFFGNPYGLPTEWKLDNYTRAWEEAHVSITLPNTVFVTACSVIGSTALASLIAYGISRREKPFAIQSPVPADNVKISHGRVQKAVMKVVPAAP